MNNFAISLNEASILVSRWACEKPIIKRVYFFGSRVKQTQHDDSDLDVAIELDVLDGNAALGHFQMEEESWRRDLVNFIPWAIDIQLLHSVTTPNVCKYLLDGYELVYMKP